jgi:hypothetical protein
VPRSIWWGKDSDKIGILTEKRGKPLGDFWICLTKLAKSFRTEVEIFSRVGTIPLIHSVLTVRGKMSSGGLEAIFCDPSITQI